MSSLSMVESELPAGFRFHPRDDELISDYLMKKLTFCEEPSLMVGVDLNKCEPWDLPETACVGGNQWYFYSQQDRKYATGIRTNRATVSGYWKATGKDRAVVKKGMVVGMRKTLVFHQGRAPKGTKTDWVMHEFRLEGAYPGFPRLPSSKSKDQDWVLCRVFYKGREGPAKPSISQATTSTSTSGDVETRSSSLPALTDSYNMAFSQTPQTHVSYDAYGDEQVPCFSTFKQDETRPSLFSIGTSSGPGCDKGMIKAVLSKFTKMEGSSSSNMKASSPASLGEGGAFCSGTYISDHVDLGAMWSHHYY